MLVASSVVTSSRPKITVSKKRWGELAIGCGKCDVRCDAVERRIARIVLYKWSPEDSAGGRLDKIESDIKSVSKSIGYMAADAKTIGDYFDRFEKEIDLLKSSAQAQLEEQDYLDVQEMASSFVRPIFHPVAVSGPDDPGQDGAKSCDSASIFDISRLLEKKKGRSPQERSYEYK